MGFLEHRLILLRRGYAPSADLGACAHRQLQTAAEAFTYQWIVDRQPELLDATMDALASLRGQQGADGLFTTGDNLASPPDTSFSINGLCRLLRVLEDRPDADMAPVRDAASEIVRNATRALISGGVHTPNHRWEISCALVQVWHLFGDPACLDRAHEWLAEGIDLQPDGLFSERSPNYAVHVTGPCLLDMSFLLERPDLAEAVHTHLHAIVPLVDERDEVDTTASRRQDQRSAFPLAHYALLYRRLAVARGCDTCAAMANRAERGVVIPDVDAVAQCLLDPRLDDDLAPAHSVPATPPGWQLLATSRLAVWRRDAHRLVAHAASDVGELGRLSSGIGADPTFLTVDAPGLRLGLRLSRDFFNLGPFRAERLRVERGDVILDEQVEAYYYQPLPPRFRRPDGDYELEFEGRFAAQMAFSHRERTSVPLGTTVRITPAAAGVQLRIDSEGASAPHVLEIALRGRPAPGATSGAIELLDERTSVARGDGELADGRLHVHLDGQFDTTGPVPEYNPGETYRFLGGTDAVRDARVLLAFRGPGTRRISLTARGPA